MCENDHPEVYRIRTHGTRLLGYRGLNTGDGFTLFWDDVDRVGAENRSGQAGEFVVFGDVARGDWAADFDGICVHCGEIVAFEARWGLGLVKYAISQQKEGD